MMTSTKTPLDAAELVPSDHLTVDPSRFPLRAPREDHARHRVPVVGVGASAGGLEAFSALLRHLGGPSELAIVFVQHLDPTHTSFLCDALAKSTPLRVIHATDGVAVEGGHVYVIPPNTNLRLEDGRLRLSSRGVGASVPHLPIDHFFRSLAQDRGNRAMGVVLSGTASDGTEGLRAIQQAEGLSFAQEPSTARYAEMPQSALTAGVVDACLPLAELAAELGRLSRHAYVAPTLERPLARDGALMRRILAAVCRVSHVDFSGYKESTFERRLARRMALRRANSLSEYLEVLEASPDEAWALQEDCLLHVTSFFRDPDVYETLKSAVFPVIARAKTGAEAIRVWVAGCSTGEEVYSVAIALREYLGDAGRSIQIFGSDVSKRVIEVARAGVYPESALRGMGDERRQRYFSRVERGFRIAKAVRDSCVFVQHDLSRDPPLSKMDLVSCRNVLIYLHQRLQNRIVPTLHYALAKPGFLVLGRAESVGRSKHLFRTVDRGQKIFERTSAASTLHLARGQSTRPGAHPAARAVATAPSLLKQPRRSHQDHELTERLGRWLVARYAPPCFVVNEGLEVLHVRGSIEDLVERPGRAGMKDLVRLGREELTTTLRVAIHRAKATHALVRMERVELGPRASRRWCDLVVSALPGVATDEPAYAVLVENVTRSEDEPAAFDARRDERREEARRPAIEQELAATKDYLQTLIEEHARATEEVAAANEELVTGNEELQSMNEELQTAKEELQSTIEELTTVNDELQARHHEMSQMNGDLVNLLATVDIPILILDKERRIRRFTPQARHILNVLPSDVGRPFEDIRTNIEVVDLDEQIAEVIRTMTMREQDVLDKEGHWYRLQIRPYKTTDDRIDGAILSLLDINTLKTLVDEAVRANETAERANRAKDEFLATLSHELRTPLNSMLMRAQLLQRGVMDDEAKLRRAGEAMEAGVMLQVQLIDDLLDVSRIVTGKIRMELRPVDPAAVVHRVVETLSTAAERKSLSVSVTLPRDGSTWRVSADETRLVQIVTNLLGNAIKFTPRGGSVAVSVAIQTEHVVIRVDDTGIGIDPRFLPHVFGRFTQANSTSTRAHGGLGLGLAIVRHLVELLEGTVTAKSDGPGQGSSFSVELPLMAALSPTAPGLEPGPSRAVIDSALLYGLRVLVVDDDAATRDVLADILAPTGADVRLAPSVAEALQLVGEFRPELLLSDIAMPGEDGYALMKCVRELAPDHGSGVRALALTALAHDDDRERALAAGYELHLAKPVDIDRLVGAMLQLLRSRPAPVAPGVA